MAQRKIGLILAGGAARGAFQAGVVSSFAKAGLSFHCIVGTSVGAVNGGAFLLGYGEDLPGMWRENLRDVKWLDRSRIWRGKNPFLISEAMRIMVSKYADIGTIRSHPTEMLVSVTEWNTGKNVLFSNHEHQAWTDDEIVLQFLASLTIPIVCSEKIVIRGTRYCDGALSINMPIHALLERECSEIIIVDPSPNNHSLKSRFLKSFVKPLKSIPSRSTLIVSGLLHALTAPAPSMPETLPITWIQPGPELLTASSLNFTALEAIDRAIDGGVEAGERALSQF